MRASLRRRKKMDYEINEMASELEAELNPDVMEDQELQGIVGNEIDDAIDFIDNWVSPIRATATRLATRRRAAVKWSAWTCATPCRRSCRL